MTLDAWMEKWAYRGEGLGALAKAELHQVVHQAVVEEREACAKVAEASGHASVFKVIRQGIANDIRQRK
jgi:hypothetical protein